MYPVASSKAGLRNCVFVDRAGDQMEQHEHTSEPLVTFEALKSAALDAAIIQNELAELRVSGCYVVPLPLQQRLVLLTQAGG